MTEALIEIDESIRREADEILKGRGLLEILNEYGTPYLTGSYALQLMTWRDLDIYLEADNIREQVFFELGGRLASALRPTRMSFRNERIAETEGLPHGLYWGIYQGNEREGAWKIDIWAVTPSQRMKLTDYCDSLAKQITPKVRLSILRIKSHCWQDPEYRRSFSSQDIYRAVLEKGIADIEGFRQYLQMKDKR